MDVGSLVKCMKSLERDRKVEREEMANAQVRTLATTLASKEQLIAGIDTLITAAENNESKDLVLYRELRLQALILLLVFTVFVSICLPHLVMIGF